MHICEKTIKNIDKRLLSKKKQLIKYAQSVLDHESHKNELSCLLQQFEITKQQVIEAYVNYDLDIFSYENEIYDSIVMRFVLHLHNLLEGSWHIERQQIVLKYLQTIHSNKIIDVGFGTPGLYVKKLLEKKEADLTLCDLADSAFCFAQGLLSTWDENWSKMVTLRKLNMEDRKFVGCYDTYIFQDSIEHVSDPTSYLITQVQAAPSNSNFILSIPIGPMIPSHYIEWRKTEDALFWLDCCGLKVLYSDIVHVNPKVDLFAEQIGNNLYDFFVLCKKNTHD